jgi:hypothetical protein
VREKYPDGGTILEFGVGNGRSYYEFAREICKGWNCKLIGFDSFQGMPKEPDNVRRLRLPQGGYKYPEGVFCFSPSVTEDRLKKLGIIRPDERFKFVPGWFKDTLTIELQQTISDLIFVNVDCDIYTSTVTVLNFIRPLLQVGTLIYFDDWYQSENGQPVNPITFGEGKAFAEWIFENPKIEFMEYRTQAWEEPDTKYIIEIIDP